MYLRNIYIRHSRVYIISIQCSSPLLRSRKSYDPFDIAVGPTREKSIQMSSFSRPYIDHSSSIQPTLPKPDRRSQQHKQI